MFGLRRGCWSSVLLLNKTKKTLILGLSETITSQLEGELMVGGMWVLFLCCNTTNISRRRRGVIFIVEARPSRISWMPNGIPMLGIRDVYSGSITATISTLFGGEIVIIGVGLSGKVAYSTSFPGSTIDEDVGFISRWRRRVMTLLLNNYEKHAINRWKRIQK